MTPDTLLFDLGVQAGTHAALYDQGIISQSDYWENIDRERRILGPRYLDDVILPGWKHDMWFSGYIAGMTNAMRPEVLAIFQEVPE